MSLSGIVDDAQLGTIVYTGSQWSHQSHNANYNRTITACKVGGQDARSTSVPPSFTFSFYGTDVKIYGGPISNSAAFSYSIDGGPVQSANINSNATGKSGANIWNLENLSAGLHTLEVLPTAGQFSLDYITYSLSPSAPALTNNLSVILDDSASSIQFSGNWSKSVPSISGGIPYEGTISGTSTKGDTMKVQFEGSSVSVYGILNQQVDGKLSASFSVDNGLSTTFSPFSGDDDDDDDDSDWSLSQQFYHQDLSPGTHSLLVTLTQVSDAQTLYIDSIVFGTTGNTPITPLAAQPTEAVSHNGSKPTLSAGKIGGIIAGIFILLSALLVFKRVRQKPFRRLNNYNRNPLPTVAPPSQQVRGPSPHFLDVDNMQRPSLGNIFHLSESPGAFMSTPSQVPYSDAFMGLSSQASPTSGLSFQSQAHSSIPTQSQVPYGEKSASSPPPEHQDDSGSIQLFAPEPPEKTTSSESMSSDIDHDSRQSHQHGSEQISKETGSNLITLTYQRSSHAGSNGLQQETEPMMSGKEPSDDPPPYNPYND